MKRAKDTRMMKVSWKVIEKKSMESFFRRIPLTQAANEQRAPSMCSNLARIIVKKQITYQKFKGQNFVQFTYYVIVNYIYYHYFQVTLKIDEKEVDYALQDKTLLSSILQEGMPTSSKK